jgi:signal transduction histidine kinase
MVTGVAHELNTPLGVANTANELVEQRGKQSLLSEGMSDEQKKKLAAGLEQACDLLRKNIARAQGLVDSFLQLSSSQLTDARGERDLAAIIKECVEAMSPTLRKKGVKTTMEVAKDLDSKWNGYPGRLSQVLVNLLQNVARYACKDGSGCEVEIQVSGDRVGDEEGFRIAFKDNGNGVAREILPHIFHPFVTSGRGSGGTGLGLAISHNIVTNLLGGSIACASEAGRGTEFIIRIPKSAPGGDATPTRERHRSPQA